MEILRYIQRNILSIHISPCPTGFRPLPCSLQGFFGLWWLHVSSLASGHRAARALGDHWKIQGDPSEILPLMAICWETYGTNDDQPSYLGVSYFQTNPYSWVQQLSLDTVWICSLKSWQICSLKEGQLPCFRIHSLIDSFCWYVCIYIYMYTHLCICIFKSCALQGRPAKLHHHGPMT